MVDKSEDDIVSGDTGCGGCGCSGGGCCGGGDIEEADEVPVMQVLYQSPSVKAAMSAANSKAQGSKEATQSKNASVEKTPAHKTVANKATVKNSSTEMETEVAKEDAQAPRVGEVVRKAELVVDVRFGHMGLRGVFRTTEMPRLHTGAKVIIKTSRGVEIGTAINMPHALITRGKNAIEGEVKRVATAEDIERADEFEGPRARHAMKTARSLIEKHKLDMRMSHAEWIFGGEKVLLYFLAEHRVDFRSLVRDLAHALHTRIEMKQIGVRDESKLLGLVANCGQELCCRRFLTDLKPVSMRMAKVQKSTLDPGKISGRCGRLLCCLRYEDNVYTELKKNIPHRGTVVHTESVVGTVNGYDILNQIVYVNTETARRVPVKLSDVIKQESAQEVNKNKQAALKKKKADSKKQKDSSDANSPEGNNSDEKSDQKNSQKKHRRRSRKPRKPSASADKKPTSEKNGNS